MTVELEYRTVGAGEPVVLVHAGVFADWFEPLLEEPSLAGRYRLVTYHRVGYAGSTVMGGRSHEVSPVWKLRQDALIASLGNAEPFVLDGATHMLHLENPRGLAERLGAFLADHPIR